MEIYGIFLCTSNIIDQQNALSGTENKQEETIS
jgi:hypothetical protein